MDFGPDLAPNPRLDTDAIPVWRDARDSGTFRASQRTSPQGRRRSEKSARFGGQVPATSVDFAGADSEQELLRCNLRGAFDRPALGGHGPWDELRGLVRGST
jgi:hypothetical protein